MNIIVLHGSPRKGGDSDTLAQTFLGEIPEKLEECRELARKLSGC